MDAFTIAETLKYEFDNGCRNKNLKKNAETLKLLADESYRLGNLERKEYLNLMRIPRRILKTLNVLDMDNY